MATLVYITVTGTYLMPDGITPKSGYIEFRPTVPLSVSGTGVIISEPLQAILDETGSFEIELLATDNADLAPTGWLWFVDEKVKNGNTWYLRCHSIAGGGTDPLNIGAGFYPPGAAVDYPIVIQPGPAGVKGDQGEVAVHSTVTGAPGTQALVEDMDPSSTKALLKFTIPEGLPGSAGIINHSTLLNLGADDHPHYLTQGRGDARYPQTAHTHTQAQSHNTPDTDTAPTALHHTLGTAANQAAAGTAPVSAVTAHVALPDPHTQYVEKVGDTLSGSLLIQSSLLNGYKLESGGLIRALVMRDNTDVGGSPGLTTVDGNGAVTPLTVGTPAYPQQAAPKRYVDIRANYIVMWLSADTAALPSNITYIVLPIANNVGSGPDLTPGSGSYTGSIQVLTSGIYNVSGMISLANLTAGSVSTTFIDIYRGANINYSIIVGGGNVPAGQNSYNGGALAVTMLAGDTVWMGTYSTNAGYKVNATSSLYVQRVA